MTFYVTETRSAYIDIDVTPEQEKAINDGADAEDVIKNFWEIADAELTGSSDISHKYEVE